MLRFIAHIERRLSPLDEATFQSNRDETDLTAYRFQMMGEAARRLSGSLKARNAAINWSGLIGMRNIIAHDYEGVASIVMWKAFKEDFAALAQVCRDELAAMGENEPDI